MKYVLIALICVLCGCANKGVPEECGRLSELISEQSIVIEDVKSAFHSGDAELVEMGMRIGSLEKKQAPIIDRCARYAISAGPRCKEFHEAGTLRDVSTLLSALKIAVEKEWPPSREFVGGMLDAASKRVASPSGGDYCLRKSQQ